MSFKKSYVYYSRFSVQEGLDTETNELQKISLKNTVIVVKYFLSKNNLKWMKTLAILV